MRMSSTATSGVSSLICSSASRPSPASPTSSRSGRSLIGADDPLPVERVIVGDEHTDTLRPGNHGLMRVYDSLRRRTRLRARLPRPRPGSRQDEAPVRRPRAELDVADERAQRLQHDHQIETEGAVLQVVEVVAELPRRARARPRVSAAHLGPAGDAGLDQLAAVIERDLPLELGDQVRNLWARPDQRHLPAQHVPKLRQLVDVRAAEDATDAGDAIVVDSRPSGAVALGVHPHRAQLGDAELAAATADADLAEEDRAAVAELHGQSRDGEDRRQHQEGGRAHDDVHGALDRGRSRGVARVHQVLEERRVEGRDRHVAEELLEQLVGADHAHLAGEAGLGDAVDDARLHARVDEEVDAMPADDVRQVVELAKGALALADVADDAIAARPRERQLAGHRGRDLAPADHGHPRLEARPPSWSRSTRRARSRSTRP